MTLERIAQMNAVYGEDLLLLIGVGQHSFPRSHTPPYARLSLSHGGQGETLLIHAEASLSLSLSLFHSLTGASASLYKRKVASLSLLFLPQLTTRRR